MSKDGSDSIGSILAGIPIFVVVVVIVIMALIVGRLVVGDICNQPKGVGQRRPRPWVLWDVECPFRVRIPSGPH